MTSGILIVRIADATALVLADGMLSGDDDAYTTSSKAQLALWR